MHAMLQHRSRLAGWSALRTVAVVLLLLALAGAASAAEVTHPAPEGVLPYVLLAMVALAVFGLVVVLAWDAVTLPRRYPYTNRPHVLHDAAREAWRAENERRERSAYDGHAVVRLRRLFSADAPRAPRTDGKML